MPMAGCCGPGAVSGCWTSRSGTGSTQASSRRLGLASTRALGADAGDHDEHDPDHGADRGDLAQGDQADDQRDRLAPGSSGCRKLPWSTAAAPPAPGRTG